MTGPNPILSICLPTMNRAELLEIGLMNVMSEIEGLGDEVEFIVTDNGSTEDIEALVRRTSPSIRFARIEEPVVFPRSILFAPRELARGEYVWIIGNDDMIVRGSVRRILDFVKNHPDLDYIYLNHGWLGIEARNRQILEKDSCLPVEYRDFQCEASDDRVMDRFEDLVALTSTNPYAMFSTIFCYVAKRQIYLDHADLIQPLDAWEDAAQTLDNMFPHAKLTMTACAGRPAGFIGHPCFIQGSYHQEYSQWIYKTMIYGHALLFQWLEHTTFDPKVLTLLWEALARMTGRLMVRLLDDPGQHQGQDIVREKALPLLVRFPAFLDAFYQEAREYAISDHESLWLAAQALAAASHFSIKNPRLAIWGLRGRGWLICKHDAWCREHLVAAVDRASTLHGQNLQYTNQVIEPPAVLANRQVDILIVATRMDLANQVLQEAATLLREGTVLISLAGCSCLADGRVQSVGLPPSHHLGAEVSSHP